MSANIEELERRRAAARLGGGEKRIAAQHAKGKLTARQRSIGRLRTDSGASMVYARSRYLCWSVKLPEVLGPPSCALR